MSKINIIINHIINEVEQGNIKQGQRLPSCRKLASELGVNKITVNKAYIELEKMHLVYSIPCGGFYLIQNQVKLVDENKSVDFKTIRPEEKLIPYREFTHVMNNSIDLYKNSLFNYEINGCHEKLREELRVLFENDGVYTSPDRILVTSGAQQAIALALQVIFKNSSKKLLVEVPTYGAALELANELGIPMKGILRSNDGYDLRELERIFKSGEVSAFYVIPRHQNPTGYSLDENTKRIIAELSSQYGVRIIEDDYLSDLGSRKNILPIHYYDIDKNTIYIRSFSKTFMPGIRIGAAVLPKDLSEKIINLKKLSDLNSSQIPQAALQLYIQSGMYSKHILKVRRAYEKKLKFLKNMLETLAPKDLYWYVPKNGIFIWFILPCGISSIALEERLNNMGIYIMSAHDCYLKEFLDDHSFDISIRSFRLCISGVSFEDLKVMSLILNEIQELKKA